MDNLSAAIGIATALGTLAAAIAAAWAVRVNQKQVATIREQAQQALEAQYDQQRPLLMPATGLAWERESANSDGSYNFHGEMPGYNTGARLIGVGLANIGPGVALDVEGRIFGAESEETTRFRGHGHSVRFALPLRSHEDTSAPGNEVQWCQGATMLSGADTIGEETRYPLHAPPTPGLIGSMRGESTYSARLTLSYRDIFGRKHASLWNFTDQGRWENVAILRNIKKDLRDLEQEATARAIPWPATALQPLSDAN